MYINAPLSGTLVIAPNSPHPMTRPLTCQLSTKVSCLVQKEGLGSDGLCCKPGGPMNSNGNKPNSRGDLPGASEEPVEPAKRRPISSGGTRLSGGNKPRACCLEPSPNFRPTSRFILKVHNLMTMLALESVGLPRLHKVYPNCKLPCGSIGVPYGIKVHLSNEIALSRGIS